MRIIITGTPGVGKTTIAKALAQKLKCKCINEHEFCEKNKIGKLDKHSGELVVQLRALQKSLKRVLEKEKDFVLEGHLVCEASLPADLVVVLTCKAAVLEKRLKRKGYSDEKTFDNLFCEQTEYCYKMAVKVFGKKRVLRVENSKGIKKTLPNILRALEK